MSFKPCIKRGFVSKKEADAFLVKLKRIYKNGENNAVRSYECPECKLWYLTSRVHPLEDDIIELHDEIEKLKEENKQLRKVENKEVKVNDWVEALAKENKKLKKEMGELRKTISDLVIRNIALQNKKEE